jgi:hypothetical protein
MSVRWLSSVLLLGLLTGLHSDLTPFKNQHSRAPGGRAARSASASLAALPTLPTAGQAAISAVLAEADSTYEIKSVSNTLRANNPRHELAAEFSTRGMEIVRGAARWHLEARSLGYGENLQKLKLAAPHARANRVEYRRDGLTEWYKNSPLGLEQGFTLSRPPGKDSKGYLTVALELSGNLKTWLAPNADALILAASRNGPAVLRYSGLGAYDALGRTLSAKMDLRGDELLLQVDDHGASYPVTIDPTITEQAELTASDPSADAIFGNATSLSADGTVLAIGAPQAIGPGSTFPGAVYVFIEPATGWATTSTFAAKLHASDGGNADFLGESVAISADGNTIVAGAVFDSSTATTTGPGSAYVFIKPSTGWASETETAKLTASDRGGSVPFGNVTNDFGGSAAINSNGTIIAIGATGATVSGSTAGPGAIYVFVEPNTGWATTTETAKLTAFGVADGSALGTVLSMSGDGSIIAAGAGNLTVGSNAAQGAAFVFVEPATGWSTTSSFAAVLTASDGVAQDGLASGLAISSDGKTIVAGASAATFSGGSEGHGAAYVFVEPAAGWTTATETAKLTASDGVTQDQFGTSTAASSDGSVIAIGANVATVVSGVPGPGAAYLFVEPATGWATTSTFADRMNSSDGQSGDFFGSFERTSLSGNGSITVVGASGATLHGLSQAGKTYVFVFPSGSVSPANLSFTEPVGLTSSTQGVTLTNSGAAPLTITNVSASAGFNTTSNCKSASPLSTGASCTEQLSFSPTATGTVNGTVTFTDDAFNVAGSTQSASLTGTGIKADTTTTITSESPNPSLVTEPVTVSFSVSAPSGDTLTPGGTVNVSASTGESCAGSAPSGSCVLVFATFGARTVTAAYLGDANFNGSVSAGITQSVGDFSISAAPASELIPSGHDGIFTVTLSPLGGFSGPVSLSCSGAPPDSTCMIVPNPVTLSGTTTAMVTIHLFGRKNIDHGTFLVTIAGQVDSLTHSTTVSLRVK